MPTTLPQPPHPWNYPHPRGPHLPIQMPQGPQQQAAHQRDVAAVQQMQPAVTTTTDAISPRAPTQPTPPTGRRDPHHLRQCPDLRPEPDEGHIEGRTGDPARLTVRHTAHQRQDKYAEHYQGVQTHTSQLNNWEFCGTMHESQPRDLYVMGVHCTLFRGLAQIHYGQIQTPFSALLRSSGASQCH